MCDMLFDVYQYRESAKELRDTLEGKYIMEDVSSKKFLVCSFNKLCFVDSRSFMDQFYETQRIYKNLEQHKINMNEILVVHSTINIIPFT